MCKRMLQRLVKTFSKFEFQAEIRFNIDNATWLPEELKDPLKKHLANRINQRGEVCKFFLFLKHRIIFGLF